jgi:hypothetical protein
MRRRVPTALILFTAAAPAHAAPRGLERQLAALETRRVITTTVFGSTTADVRALRGSKVVEVGPPSRIVIR